MRSNWLTAFRNLTQLVNRASSPLRPALASVHPSALFPTPQQHRRQAIRMSSNDSNSNRPRNRPDFINPTFTPHAPVVPLGQDRCHGPARHEHIVVVLGVGPGLGLCIAQTFAAQGYTVAILSRTRERLDAWATELAATSKAVDSESGGARAFACDATDSESIRNAIREIRQFWPTRKIGTAVYNASIRMRGDFLKLDEEVMRKSVNGSIMGGFTFAHATIQAIEEHGEGGSLLVTGASSSMRGRVNFAPFTAAKSGLRSMCQSIAKEFGPRNIHVAHIVVDGLIESQSSLDFLGMPKGSRFQDGVALYPPQMAKNWLFLAQQHPGNWTHEMDLRPAKEHF